MTSVGWATLDVIPSFSGFKGHLEKGTGRDLAAVGTAGGTTFGDAAGKSAGSRFGTVFKSAAQAGLVGVAALAAGATKLAFDSISSASDLEESTNKVTQIFGKQSAAILKFTEGTADALGQTNNEARSAAATFGIFGNAAGLADKKNAKFAKRMTRLASDLASFNNTEPDEAVQALGAALRGESEPIRAYGVMLDEATLKAEAMALGILKPVKDSSKIFAYQVRITEGQKAYNDAVEEHGKHSLEALKAEASLGTARTALQKATEGVIPPLTQQQKLLAAQSQIFKQTEVAQGDFGRTSDGLANQQRRLTARFEDAKAKLGTGLLPIMTEAADFLLEEGIPAFERFADWFNKDGIPAIKKFGDKAETVAGHVSDLVGMFKDLPDAAKIASLGGALAGGIVIKHKLAGVFDRGGIGNPMFVVVTNPGGLPGSKTPKTPPIVPTGLPGAIPKTFGTLPKWLKFGAIAGLGSAPGQDSLMKKLLGFGLGGSDQPKMGTDAQWDALLAKKGESVEATTQALRDFYLTGDIATNAAKRLGIQADANVNVFEEFYRKTGRAKDGADQLYGSLGRLAETRVRPQVDTSSIEAALELFRKLPEMAGVVGPVDPSLLRTPAGVNNNFYGPIHATDTKDITRQAQRKGRERGLGGRPQP